jgi:hypothetical protein
VFSDSFDLPPKFSKEGVAWPSENRTLFQPLKGTYTEMRFTDPIEFPHGVQSDQFMVWYRTAHTSRFRKLYAKWTGNENMEAGVYNITVRKQWIDVNRTVVFAHNGKGGGRNFTMIIINAVSAVVYAFFAFLGALLTQGETDDDGFGEFDPEKGESPLGHDAKIVV